MDIIFKYIFVFKQRNQKPLKNAKQNMRKNDGERQQQQQYEHETETVISTHMCAFTSVV